MATTKPDEDDSGVYSLVLDPPLPAPVCSSTLTADKRRAVRSYFTDLGPALRTKYGREPFYAPVQVKEVATELALRIDYLCWAYALYCSPPVFESLHSAGEVCDYLAMRTAVGDVFFNGNAGFVTPAVVDAIISGTASATASGAFDATGWLVGIDWTNVLDWS